MNSHITIRGARLHNLKNINLVIPKNRLVVLTGVSGSGKSTLGFDILFKEGQRQYLEALGFIAYGMAKPPVDAITGLSPSISVDQNLTNRSPRSTVGTVTDVYTYLRVLFARLGHRPCPSCRKDVPPTFATSDLEWEQGAVSGDDVVIPEGSHPCPHCGAPIPEISMAHFSFNKPDGACPTCTGIGKVQQVDERRLINDEKNLSEGAVSGWNAFYTHYQTATLEAAAIHYGFEFDPSLPVKDYTASAHDLLIYGVDSPLFRRHFPAIGPPATVRKGRFEGIATSLLRRYAEHVNKHIHDPNYRDKLEDFLVTQTCPDCNGTRLRLESRQVMVNGQSIIALSHLSLSELETWVNDLPAMLDTNEILVARPILEGLKQNISRLVEVNVGYLTLDQSSPSLSAGESQRLRLASLLGSGLSGVLYVFDEPTIGLHHRDTRRLINILFRLRDLGNTVLIIEHDLDMINAADYVIDFGPGAGKHGGQVVGIGTPEQIKKKKSSLTADYLARRISIPTHTPRCTTDTKAITIRGARQNNLKNITVRFPLGLLIAVTGVSGSGKSSLVFDILDRAVRQRLYRSTDVPGVHDLIEGIEYIDKLITIDQEHLTRMPRSNAATYTEVFTPIREVYASMPESERLGFSTRHFSFNVPSGRCKHCEGTGILTIQMHFLPDVEVRCPVCHGRRFMQEILAVRYRDHDVSQVLDLTVEEALELFRDVPAVCSRLQLLSDVGLGYLQLGQPATTLSGGEAQRIKLARELGRRSSGHTLYLLDEPTTGLHLADTDRLLGVLQRLVDAGNSVILIEHNLEVIKAADWVIDLGPEGGALGGQVVAQGTPEQITKIVSSYTGQSLREVF